MIPTPLQDPVPNLPGIRMEAGKVVISPVPGYLKDYSGHVPVPGGTAEFRFANGQCTILLPKGTDAILRRPEGTDQRIPSGTEHTFTLQ